MLRKVTHYAARMQDNYTCSLSCGWIKAANRAIHTILHALQCGQYGMHCSVISNQPATKAAIFFTCNASVYFSVTRT